MTRKRIFSLLLALLLILPMLPVPVFAEETINDLTKVYNNLSNYLYQPYYKDSEYFEEYRDVMEELDELLKTDSITQAEIVKYYNGLREVYSKLMQDTYDYSSLNTLIRSFEALPATLFTEESWKKMVSIHDSAKKELEAPTLFYRKTTDTKKSYTKTIQEHIATYTADFAEGFAALERIEVPEEMTKAYLSDYAAFIRFCAREELLGKTEAWDDLQDALKDADTAVGLGNPRQARLDNAYADLTAAFAAAASEGYDFTKAKEALADHKAMAASQFSDASWVRYDAEIRALEDRLGQAHFFFMPLGSDEETCRQYAKAYTDALPQKALEAKDMLVSVEDYEKLLSLCQSEKDRTAIEGLDLKLATLKKHVKDGEAYLADENATGQQIRKAIENIENATEDLTMAEGYLKAEQDKVVKQDAHTIRYTVIFTVASVALAALFAVILSRRYFGKVNWTR